MHRTTSRALENPAMGLHQCLCVHECLCCRQGCYSDPAVAVLGALGCHLLQCRRQGLSATAAAVFPGHVQLARLDRRNMSGPCVQLLAQAASRGWREVLILRNSEPL